MRPVQNLLTQRCAIRSQSIEILMQLFSDGGHGQWHSDETTHPGFVAVKQMIERSMNGLEECPQVLLPLLVGNAAADLVQFFVHPLIVARHQFERFFNDHFCSPYPASRSRPSAHEGCIKSAQHPLELIVGRTEHNKAFSFYQLPECGGEFFLKALQVRNRGFRVGVTFVNEDLPPSSLTNRS
jgi:hypothetical protein